MYGNHAFRPLTNAVTIAATATDQSVNIPGVGDDLLIVNAATAPLLVAFGLAAADSDPVFQFAVPAASAITIRIGRDQYIACRLSTGTGNVYVTRGDGMV
jgi:hypothetical protein